MDFSGGCVLQDGVPPCEISADRPRGDSFEGRRDWSVPRERRAAVSVTPASTATTGLVGGV